MKILNIRTSCISTLLLLCSATIYAEHLVYIPQDMRQSIDANDTAIHLKYGPFSQKEKYDALVITINAKDRKKFKSDYQNLYTLPRSIYIFSWRDQKWQLLGKNDVILKPVSERENYSPNIDQVEFIRDDDPQIPPYLYIIREGENRKWADSQASFNLKFDPENQKVYVTEESYSYKNPENEFFPCSITQKYPLGQQAFNTFTDHEDALISAQLKTNTCENVIIE
ncbi:MULTISPECIES: hypothetical protein [Acinetobacter]|uniref:Uncharacterized protein n=1 Tax=Acinetobacter piscicola TaxID=2006115 RepID=A0A7S6VVM2_9GAMM|nr:MULTISPECIES: hypothetical protein [Acinetobacter]QOW45643.1 hypothetical protein G0028_06895 [Acinetobacter piscicola]